jgi:hypothetical protein
MSLKFRPHHFLCTLGFEGKGYSEEFVRGYQLIADQLRKRGIEGDRTKVEVVESTDSICQPCLNRQGTRCATEEKIRALDEAHMKVLGIRGGDVLTWGEAKKKIAENMTVEAHHKACAPCAWRSLGLCEAALLKLRREHLEHLEHQKHPETV